MSACFRLVAGSILLTLCGFANAQAWHVSAAHERDYVNDSGGDGRSYLVQVSDEKGNPVLGLTDQNFAIRQGAVPPSPPLNKPAAYVSEKYKPEELGVYLVSFNATFSDEPVLITVTRLLTRGSGVGGVGARNAYTAMTIVGKRDKNKAPLPDDF